MQQILAGKYKLIRNLGKGASCEVKLAKHLSNNETFAIKIFQKSNDEKLEELFLNEVSVMDTLKHKNVIKYIEYGTGDIVRTEDNVVKSEKRVNYIVLELAQQGDLFDVIARLGSFEESLAKYFFIQLMEGLEFCHN